MRGADAGGGGGGERSSQVGNTDMHILLRHFSKVSFRCCSRSNTSKGLFARKEDFSSD